MESVLRSSRCSRNSTRSSRSPVGRLKFRFQPPTPVNNSYVFGEKAEHFQNISKVRLHSWTASIASRLAPSQSKRKLKQAESVMSIMDCDDELAFLKDEVERILHGKKRPP